MSETVDYTRGMAKKRGYSRAFGPRIRTAESRRRIHLDWVPPTLYDKVVARANREGVSVRALVLNLLTATVPHGHPIRQREMKAAHRATAAAIRRGELVRPERCPECGQMPKGRSINSHHPNYDNQTTVEWVCDRCHGQLSQKLLTWSDMPQALRIALREKLEREGISLRALTLTLWKDWTDRDGR